MKQTCKLTIRLEESDRLKIEAELKEFGFASLSDFVRQSVTEKLERLSIGKQIEEGIKRQDQLNTAIASVLKTMVNRDTKNEEMLASIAKSLANFNPQNE